MEQKPKRSRVLQLRVSNFMRVSSATITPKGAVTVLSGRNGQGKSSFLRALQVAAGGKRAHPAEPLRTGADAGEVVTVYGRDGSPELFVRVVFTRGQDARLFVEDKDGVRIGKPQEALNRLIGTVAIDPLRFVHPPGAETPEAVAKYQREELLKVLDLGIDFDALAEERRAAFTTRTDVTRALKAAQGRLAALGNDEDEPEGLDVAAASEAVMDAEREDNAAKAAANEADRHTDRLAAIDRERDELERRLAKLATERRDVEDKRAAAHARANAPRRHDLTTAKERLAAAQRGQGEARAVIQRNAERKGARESAAMLAARESALTETIASCDRTKAEAFAGAKMPVPGLGIDERGVTILGPDGIAVPFSQASWAQQIVCSCRLAIAGRPECGTMIVRDGNALDEDSFAALARIAEEEDLDLWIERVAQDIPGAIVIEDGMVDHVIGEESAA